MRAGMEAPMVTSVYVFASVEEVAVDVKLTVVQPTADSSSQFVPVKLLTQIQLHIPPLMMLCPPLLHVESFSQISRAERFLFASGFLFNTSSSNGTTIAAAITSNKTMRRIRNQQIGIPQHLRPLRGRASLSSLGVRRSAREDS